MDLLSVIFLKLGENLCIAQLCKGAGLTVEAIKRLFGGETLSVTGKLHSQEHDRDFNVENAKLQLFRDRDNPDKLKLSINSQNIIDWFREQYLRMKQATSHYERPNIKPEVSKNKGIKRELYAVSQIFAKFADAWIILFAYCANYANEQGQQFLLILSALSLKDPEHDAKVNLVAKKFDQFFTISSLIGAGDGDNNDRQKLYYDLNKSIRNKTLSELNNAFDSVTVPYFNEHGFPIMEFNDI